MQFKAYDILSSLIPGFLVLLVVLKIANMGFDKDLAIAYTAVAFLLGYLVNTLASWMEDIYYFSWGGKPSSRLLDGKDIWKVKFYTTTEVKELLKSETSNPNPKNDELFGIAMRYANGEKDTRIDDFNASFAFSRALLTCAIICTILLLLKFPCNLTYYSSLIAVIVIWLRCKQRGYYYAKEVLNVYLKIKKK